MSAAAAAAAAAAGRRRVAVIFGGQSAEHEISVVSARSVVDALDPERFDVVAIGIDREGLWHLLPEVPAAGLDASSVGQLPTVDASAGSPVRLARDQANSRLVAADGQERPIDVVFPVLHGPHGEDGSIQGLLEVAGIPYVGAGVLGSAAGMDKAVQKSLAVAAGLAVVSWVTVYEREWRGDAASANRARDAIRALGWPTFVKPANLGSSVGISKVHDESELDKAMEHAFAFDEKVVVEQGFADARELECAVLGNDDPQASVVGEVVPSHEFYDYSAKYLDASSTLHIPADIPDELTTRIQALAIRAFQSIDCAGMARVDLFYRDSDEALVLNELNTIPGFTSISMYPKLWEASGLAYADLLERLIELALERHASRQSKGRALPG